MDTFIQLGFNFPAGRLTDFLYHFAAAAENNGFLVIALDINGHFRPNGTIFTPLPEFRLHRQFIGQFLPQIEKQFLAHNLCRQSFSGMSDICSSG